jgi:formate hydrogenlyase subunit 3/multisubunit Na+/H+ antiporter MnhD subunit
MDAPVFIVFLFSSFLLFILPRAVKYNFTLLLISSSTVLTSIWCFEIFNTAEEVLNIRYSIAGLFDFPLLTIDRLSAFFIVVINITVFTGILFAKGYLEPYQNTKRQLSFTIHYFAYLWLYFSMLLVVMLRDGFAFLINWELMSLSSFLLVIFDAEDRSTLKTGINYLIQMHVGFAMLLIAFLITEKATGTMSFDALTQYFSGRPNILLFLLFFIGFGIKAGFIPMHTWLPEAHPAAPSHVSGVMSGVMIKMGIYGLLRVLLSVQSDLLWIGTIILAVSLISGILGVMTAIIQHDLKRLLAYHSIENIGIIGIGIGLGIIGKATGNNGLALLGLSGGLLHVLNHSLFKSLLFYGAGSVYRAAHTRTIDHLGGLIKKMPYTAVFFLIGSLAICGLPPFNGFISEYLIYLGMFKSLSGANLYQIITILFSIIGLTLIGGLAVFCFTKAFGMVFLGQHRSANAQNAVESGKGMLVPQVIIIVLILMIGLGSSLFVKPIFKLITEVFHLKGDIPVTLTSINSLQQISILGGMFILLIVAILIYRRIHLRTKVISYGPTWGCGYTAGSHKQQYTATSYADNFGYLANPVMGNRKVFRNIEANDIFPGKRKFLTHNFDVFKRYMIDNPITVMQELLKKIAIMQTGQIQHYILYAFVFMLIVFILTFFKAI